MEPGVQTPEETLEKALGSCRDTGWLLVETLRQLGLAARFVSGYLIQLAPDQKSLDGPSGTEVDFTDLHAWCEVFLPGAGWIGLDPTSGLLAGEGHIPVACTPEPGSAAPIFGAVDESEVEFEHIMQVQRVLETPRVTKPYTEEVWTAVQKMGAQVDQRTDRHGRAPDDGRRAHVRRRERPRRGGMEHRRTGSDEARLCRLADGQVACALWRGRLSASRSGQVVSGRAVAALGHVAVLACGWRADLGRPEALRR